MLQSSATLVGGGSGGGGVSEKLVLLLFPSTLLASYAKAPRFGVHVPRSNASGPLSNRVPELAGKAAGEGDDSNRATHYLSLSLSL